MSTLSGYRVARLVQYKDGFFGESASMADCLGEGCGLPYASADDSTFTLRGQTGHRHTDS